MSNSREDAQQTWDAAKKSYAGILNDFQDRVHHGNHSKEINEMIEQFKNHVETTENSGKLISEDEVKKLDLILTVLMKYIQADVENDIRQNSAWQKTKESYAGILNEFEDRINHGSHSKEINETIEQFKNHVVTTENSGKLISEDAVKKLDLILTVLMKYIQADLENDIKLNSDWKRAKKLYEDVLDKNKDLINHGSHSKEINEMIEQFKNHVKTIENSGKPISKDDVDRLLTNLEKLLAKCKEVKQLIQRTDNAILNSVKSPSSQPTEQRQQPSLAELNNVISKYKKIDGVNTFQFQFNYMQGYNKGVLDAGAVNQFAQIAELINRKAPKELTDAMDKKMEIALKGYESKEIDQLRKEGNGLAEFNKLKSGPRQKFIDQVTKISAKLPGKIDKLLTQMKAADGKGNKKNSDKYLKQAFDEINKLDALVKKIEKSGAFAHKDVKNKYAALKEKINTAKNAIGAAVVNMHERYKEQEPEQRSSRRP